MPTISAFYGMLIQMFWNEHAPPHFHVVYGDCEALIDIRKLEIIEGRLPRRAQVLVIDWAEMHQEELLEDWQLCEQLLPPRKIKPLE